MSDVPPEIEAPLSTPGSPTTNWRAYVAAVTGVGAALTTVFPIPYLPVLLAIAAVGFGISGLQEGGPQHRGRWLAVSGIVLGGVCLLYVTYLVIAGSIAGSL